MKKETRKVTLDRTVSRIESLVSSTLVRCRSIGVYLLADPSGVVRYALGRRGGKWQFIPIQDVADLADESGEWVHRHTEEILSTDNAETVAGIVNLWRVDRIAGLELIWSQARLNAEGIGDDSRPNWID